MFHLGVLLRGRGQTDEADRWYERAAKAGDASAMFNLGMLRKGRGETDEAEQWYRQAAEGR